MMSSNRCLFFMVLLSVVGIGVVKSRPRVNFQTDDGKIGEVKSRSRVSFLQTDDGKTAGLHHRIGGARQLLQTSSPIGPVLHMVYMQADTDLDAVQDMDELIVGSTDARHGSMTEYILIVLIDRCKGSDNPHDNTKKCKTNELHNIVHLSTDGSSSEPVSGNFSTAKLLRLRPGFWEQLSDWGEVNMDSPGTLTRFMNECFKEVPDPTTVILQLWDHGGGYVGFGGDWSSNEEGMSLSSIKNAISASLAANKVSKLDLLGFDTCVMASFTVLEILNPVTKWVLASEVDEPGTGWNYALINRGAASIPSWARTVIDAFMLHPSSGSTSTPGRQLSLLDMQYFQQYQRDLVVLIHELAFKTRQGSEPFMKAISKARRDAIAISVQADKEKKAEFDAVDIGSFLTNLMEQIQLVTCGLVFNEVLPKVENALRSYTALVSYSRSDQSIPYTGMHIIFPEYDYQELADTWFYLYWKYDWEDLPGLRAWRDFLDAHYDKEVEPERPPECQPSTPWIVSSPSGNTTFNASFYIGNPEVLIFPRILQVRGIGPDTAVSSDLYFGITFQNGDGVLWLGRSRGDVSVAANATQSSVSGFWNGYIPYMFQRRARYDPRPVDGNSTGYSCLPYFTPELVDTNGDGTFDQEKLTVPVLYFPPLSSLTNQDLRNHNAYSPFDDRQSSPAILYVTINSTTIKPTTVEGAQTNMVKFTWALYANTYANTTSEITKEMGGKIVPIRIISMSEDVDSKDFKQSWCLSYFVWGDPDSDTQAVGELDIHPMQLFDRRTLSAQVVASIVTKFDVKPLRGAIASVQAIAEVDSEGDLSEPKVQCKQAALCYMNVTANSATMGMVGKRSFVLVLFSFLLVALQLE